MTAKHSVPHVNSRPVTNKDFSNTAYSGGESQQSDRLHGRSKQIVDKVLASLDDDNYQAICSTTELAKHFGMMAGTMQMTLRGPVELGLLTIKQGRVYPTAKLLERQGLSADASAALLRCLNK